jgi:CPA2 family monovalent cation:H+ antiporter-2
MQDLIGIFLIIAVTTVPFEVEAVLTNIMYGAMIIVGALVLRDHVFAAVAARAQGSRELLMLTGMAVLTGFVFLSEFLDISIVVGAFAAGMAVSKYPHKIEMLDIMGPLKDFFSVIFFVVLGALVTVPDVMTLVIAACLIGITSIIKPALTTLLLSRKGYDNRTAFITSMGIDHVSEFALIVAIQAFIAGSIAPAVFQGIILAAVGTMTLSADPSRHAYERYARLEHHHIFQTNHDKLEEQTHITQKLDDHIILVGYGVQGKLIAEALQELGEIFVVVDNDPEEITEANTHEENTLFGNVLDDRTWERARADSAKLVISTIPHRDASAVILDVDTDADIILRATRFDEAQELLDDGALYVNVPDLMAADQLTAILQTVLTSEEYAAELRRRNLMELRDYFYSSDEA